MRLECPQADDAEAKRKMPSAHGAPRYHAPARTTQTLAGNICHTFRNGTCRSLMLSYIRWRPARSARERGQATGVRFGQLTRDHLYAALYGLFLVRRHRAGVSAEPADRTRRRQTRHVGARAGGKDRRSLPLHRQSVI